MADATTPTTEDEFNFESVANKEYPLAPIGEHKLKVVRALFQMRDPHPKAKSQDKVRAVQLMIASDQTYKNDADEDEPYHLFITMNLTDFESSSLTKFFHDVIGMPIPIKEIPRDDGTTKKVMSLGVSKVVKMEDKEDEVHMPAFENLEFKGIVKHKVSEKSGKMKDYIDSLFATPEQQAMNAALFQAPAA